MDNNGSISSEWQYHTYCNKTLLSNFRLLLFDDDF